MIASRCMHPQYRRALARVVVTSWPSRGCGNIRCYSRQWACRTRNIYETSASDPNTGHPQPRARSQSRATGYPTDLLLQTHEALAGARRVMGSPRNPDTLLLYDWRTFAPGAQLHYIRSEDVANQRIARLASRPGPFTIGLDFEWRPNFVARRPENPISLVQVACDDEVLLVQVARSAFPANLRDLLESATSTKVGVGIQYDCKKLWKDHRVSVRNCVDLALLARSVDPQWKGPYKGGIGLSRLAETYIGRMLPKTGRIQRSDWEMELSMAQQEYAANDSHASLTIHRVLVQRALEIAPGPEPEWFTFDGVEGVLRDEQGRPWFPCNPRYDPGLPSSSADSETGTA